MFNSVRNETELSCIDHVYSNYKHKCSLPRVVVNGASDHDAVSYIQYSKAPPNPSRTIRRRSYKNFRQEDFLADISAIDWTDVYVANDIDTATSIFTDKFKYILNLHAPWVIFQQN